MEFEFSGNVINRVATEIEHARKYVKMAVFQIHNKSIYDAVEKILAKGIQVEILTLPYDSIKEDIRNRVESRIEEIKKKGAKVYFSKWGIGDPERTNTAVGRWYSFHGKFVVTDSVAISLSANLTEEAELDAMLIFREEEKIREFNEKFSTLLKLFVQGGIKNMIEQTTYGNKDVLFAAPRSITEEEVKSHWIRDYPLEICNEPASIENKLYIAPIECRARELWKKIISEAREYVYISTESFTDTSIIPFLIKNSIQGKKVKILTGSESQDFNERIRELYPRLIANDVELRKPKQPLHAKLIVTEKRLVVSSVNLNKMNLGFPKSKALWRANTETITVESNSNIIKEAKDVYDSIFADSIRLLDYLSEKEKDYAMSIFSVYDVKPDKKVRDLLSKVIVISDVKLKRDLYQIGRYASILLKKFNKGKGKVKNIVETSDFLCAMVLLYLSDRKHTESELMEKLSELSPENDNRNVIKKLLEYKLIIREDGFFKLDLHTLLGEA